MSARLVVFSGPACSGKTVLGAELARRLGAPHLQMDTTRARLMPDSQHTRHDRAIAYRAMHLAAELLLGSGVSVILDAQYAHPEDRGEVDTVAARTGSPIYLIECKVAPEIAVRRFRERAADHPGLDLTPDLVAGMARTFPYRGTGLLIDTGELPPEECSRRIDAYVTTADTGAAG